MYMYYLKFPNEQTMKNVLFINQPEGDGLGPKYTAVDVIGVIYKLTGPILTSEEGVQYQDVVEQPGYHANVRHVDEAPELEQYQVFPATPERVWA